MDELAHKGAVLLFLSRHDDTSGSRLRRLTLSHHYSEVL
jgi:hypothetical protein